MEKPIKGSNIPFINLSKESLKLIVDMLEGDEMSLFMTSLYDYSYEGVEPDFKTKVLRSVWNNVISVIERKSESYFNKLAANKENGKKGGRPRKNADITPNTEFENSPNKPELLVEDIIPQKDIKVVSNAQEMDDSEVLDMPCQYTIEEDIYTKLGYIMEPYNLHDGDKFYKRIEEVGNNICIKYPKENKKEIIGLIYDMIDEYKNNRIAS